MLASIEKYAGNRFLFNARDPLDAADAVTFKQEPENHQRLFFAEIHIAEKSFAFLLESALALLALESLNAFAIFSGFDSFNFAVVAGHGLSY
jgi:hypothetical protein